MRRQARWGRRPASIVVAVAALVLAVRFADAAALPRVVQVSRCARPNAEPQQAVSGRFVYEAWMGCGGRIGFTRSVNGGATFEPSRRVLGTETAHGWDPALAVAPDGTVYVSYMIRSLVAAPGGVAPRLEMTPAVAVSVDHGRSFARVSRLPVPPSATAAGNWGDRDFIAVGSDGTVYVTWDYGPSYEELEMVCSRAGSCAFSRGDFNAVVQKSTDGGMTWTSPHAITPGFPLGGAFSAPIVVEPDGTLAVLYLAHPTAPSTLTVGLGTEYFTSSSDGGATWSSPVAVDPEVGTIALTTWWVDGSLAVDPSGTLYATWDTQTGPDDTGWLAWSSDGGRTWSPALRVSSGSTERLVEVAAAGMRSVYVAWQTLGRKGYATYVRRLAVGGDWTGPVNRISRDDGAPAVWPGDTFGLSSRGGAAVASWGSSGDIYATRIALPAHR